MSPLLPTATAPDMTDALALTALEMASALRAFGLPVVPHGPRNDRWRIGDLIWTHRELVALAARAGVSMPTTRPQ